MAALGLLTSAAEAGQIACLNRSAELLATQKLMVRAASCPPLQKTQGWAIAGPTSLFLTVSACCIPSYTDAGLL